MAEYQKEQIIIEWLRDYTSYKASIKNLKEREEDVINEGMGIDYSKTRTSCSNKFNSDTENKFVRLNELGIQHKIKVMTNIITNVDKALDSLTDVEKAVITNRCINGQYYYQFCYQIGASERTAKRIKKEALRKMTIVIFGKE